MVGREKLPIEKVRQIQPVVLAYLGDAVYSLYIREKQVVFGGGNSGDFQLTSSKLVSAEGQAELVEKILPILSEDELDFLRRGKNAKKKSKSKNASLKAYSTSTGFETLVGALYLTGQDERLKELFSYADESKLFSKTERKELKP